MILLKLQPVLVGHTECLAASIGLSGLGLDFPLTHRGNENRTEVAVFLAQGVFIRGERGLLVFCESLFHAARLMETVKKEKGFKCNQISHLKQVIDFSNEVRNDWIPHLAGSRPCEQDYIRRIFRKSLILLVIALRVTEMFRDVSH